MGMGMGSRAEGARGHGRSTGAAAFLYRPGIGCKHEEDWCFWKRAGRGEGGSDGAGVVGLRFASLHTIDMIEQSCFVRLL
jgi:hypothetical protein